MSDGITIAVITLVGGIIVAMIQTRRKREEKDRAQDTLSTRGQGAANVSVNVPVNVSVNAPAGNTSTHGEVLKIAPPAQPGERRLNARHMQIVEAIEAPPLFHRSDVEASYKGARVLWRVKVSGIDKRAGGYFISGSLAEDGSLVFCRANPGDCEGLEFADRSTFEVDGEIERVSRYETWLEDCRIRVVEENISEK